MSRNRASSAELMKRREEVQELILHGHNAQFIVEKLSKHYKTSKRAIQEDIRLIGKEWQEKDSDVMQMKRNLYYDRLQMMFNVAYTGKQYKLALDIQKEIHKLDGIYEQADEKEDTLPKFINITRREPLKIVNDDEQS